MDPEIIHDEELLNGNEKCIAERSADQITSSGSPGRNDIFGDPPVRPRLGEQYQVEIPYIMTESECIQLQHSEINRDDSNYYGYVCLALPIMWVYLGGDDIKDEQQEPSGTTSSDAAGSVGFIHKSQVSSVCSIISGLTHKSSENQGTLPEGTKHKVEPVDDSLELGEEFARTKSKESMFLNGQKSINFARLSKGYNPLPGLPVTSWTDAEMRTFVLGLYIFGKNLVQIRKLMDDKKMGDILSFYYGKFFRSAAYRRWVECRKIRSRRCIHGQRIFTGWRQPELLSRLLPIISEEVQSNLLQAMKFFSERRISLQELVFTLKALVGIEALVEAVGIGKGKHDLTGIVVQPVRRNPVNTIRSEIPIGKACSSLTTDDIIKFLTGDFRLSKAKSNDLFWEAVWPRLLARGWHSEQPKDHTSAGSKNALVFLFPGIDKFSRRKLVKGNHYFDSISDVLKRVAAEPWLLELEGEGFKESGSKDGGQWDVNTGLNPHSMSDHQTHRYVCPRLPNCNSEYMKLTIVDTSLVHGEAPFKVRELRSLPLDFIYSQNPSICSGETDSSSSTEKLPSADTSSNDQEESEPCILRDKNLKNVSSVLVTEVLRDQSDNLVTVTEPRSLTNKNVSNDLCHISLTDKQEMKDFRCQFSRRMKSSQSSYCAPASKRQRLNSCGYAETGRPSYLFSRGRQPKEEHNCKLKSLKAGETIHAETGPLWGKLPASSLAESSADKSGIYIASGNSVATGAPGITGLLQKRPQPRTLIDLNLPHYPPELDSAKTLCSETAGIQYKLTPKESSLPSGAKQLGDDIQTSEIPKNELIEQQPRANLRRQSTRNRPPTTKALEALACGLLSTRRRRRSTKASPSNMTSRSTHQARSTVGAPTAAPSVSLGITSPDIMVSNVGIYGECSSSTNHASIFGMTLVPSGRSEAHELLGVP